MRGEAKGTFRRAGKDDQQERPQSAARATYQRSGRTQCRDPDPISSRGDL